jgi:hypothetical protein
MTARLAMTEGGWLRIPEGRPLSHEPVVTPQAVRDKSISVLFRFTNAFAIHWR